MQGRLGPSGGDAGGGGHVTIATDQTISGAKTFTAPVAIPGTPAGGRGGLYVSADGRIGMLDTAASKTIGANNVIQTTHTTNPSDTPVVFDVVTTTRGTGGETGSFRSVIFQHEGSSYNFAGEFHAARDGTATNNNTWGVLASVGSTVAPGAGNNVMMGVGSYCWGAFLDVPASAKQGHTAYVAGGDGHWDRGFGYWDDTQLTVPLFEVLRSGNLMAAGKGTFGQATHGAGQLNVKQSADTVSGGVTLIQAGASTAYAALYMAGSELYVQPIGLGATGSYLRVGGTAASLGLILDTHSTISQHILSVRKNAVEQLRVSSTGTLAMLGATTIGALTDGAALFSVKQSADALAGGMRIVQTGAGTKSAAMYLDASGDVYFQQAGTGTRYLQFKDSVDEIYTPSRINSNTAFYVQSNKVVGVRGASVANATDATTVIARLNDLLARLRVTGGHGLIND